MEELFFMEEINEEKYDEGMLICSKLTIVYC